jgi:hypothetical protein
LELCNLNLLFFLYVLPSDEVFEPIQRSFCWSIMFV